MPRRVTLHISPATIYTIRYDRADALALEFCGMVLPLQCRTSTHVLAVLPPPLVLVFPSHSCRTTQVTSGGGVSEHSGCIAGSTQLPGQSSPACHLVSQAAFCPAGDQEGDKHSLSHRALNAFCPPGLPSAEAMADLQETPAAICANKSAPS